MKAKAVDPCVLIQVVFMYTIDVVIRTCNVVYIHVILYEWQLNVTNIYECINAKMSIDMSCPYFELQQLFERSE